MNVGYINDKQCLTYSLHDILFYKKRKTIVKYLMSIGFSRNNAEEEAKWIKLNSLHDILFYKKRKTIVKYLMSIGFSRNRAEEEAKWIKLNRKLCFLYAQAHQYETD